VGDCDEWRLVGDMGVRGRKDFAGMKRDKRFILVAPRAVTENHRAAGSRYGMTI
jgi:hypothetical protein